MQGVGIDYGLEEQAKRKSRVCFTTAPGLNASTLGSNAVFGEYLFSV
jgi:hypothetical protein